MHKSLVAGRKTRGDTRYSPAFISFTVLPDRPLQSTLEPRSRSSRCRPPQREDPRCRLRRRVPPSTRSSLEVPRQESSPFRSCCFCASLLKATLFSRVCTQILWIPQNLCSRAIVFEPSWPLACNIKLVFFYRVVL